MSWVLIIFLKWGYAGGVVAVPGYISPAECQQAVAAAKQNANLTLSDAFCIPAPRKESP